MRKAIILAAIVILAAAITGCELQAVIPAFLLPAYPQGTDAPAASPTESAATATPEPTPIATPTPEPTATPAPTAPAEPYEVVARYQTTLPEGLRQEMAYSKYATPLDYFVSIKGGAVYAQPDGESKKLKSLSFGTRLRADKLVLGVDGKTQWVHVLWSDSKGSHEGYVRQTAGKTRSFRLGMMLERAKQLKETADAANTVYIVNYKNRNGMPPALPGGKQEDSWGNRRNQSAPTYAEPSAKSAFRYAPDGLLGTRLEQSGGFTKIFFPSFGEARWVPDKYVVKGQDSISMLNQVIIVDRQNQNAAVFEVDQAGWKLIALTFVSTGKDGGYAVKTPLGDFMAQERASKFYYYADGTTNIAGYAPYAVRFSGGGYLHGVPRDFRHTADGQRVDPGIAESIYTLGTTPQSHMCVRNYTSFAKFVYDWFQKGQCAVIVLE